MDFAIGSAEMNKIHIEKRQNSLSSLYQWFSMGLIWAPTGRLAIFASFLVATGEEDSTGI